MTVIVEIDADRGIVRKLAEMAGDRERLAAETSILRDAAHPGVVQILPGLTTGDPELLEFRMVDGSTIAERSPLDPLEVAWVGAALATTVADLHDIGIAHRAIEPSHVLIDRGGRPVLCGFGSARRASSTADFAREKRADVAALAQMLIQSSKNLPGGRFSSALRAAANGKQRAWWRGDAIDARSLARVLGAAVPAGHPPSATPARVSRPRGRRASVLRAALLVITAAVLLYAAVQSISRVHDRAGVATAGAGAAATPIHADSPGPCPPQDDGCVPVADPAGVVGGRFRVLGAAGVIVLGRWACTSEATPAVLDLASGAVWVFDSWPASHQHETARLVATVRDASSLSVVPQRAGECDRIAVARTGRRAALLDPRQQ